MCTKAATLRVLSYTSPSFEQLCQPRMLRQVRDKDKNCDKDKYNDEYKYKDKRKYNNKYRDKARGRNTRVFCD